MIKKFLKAGGDIEATMVNAASDYIVTTKLSFNGRTFAMPVHVEHGKDVNEGVTAAVERVIALSGFIAEDKAEMPKSAPAKEPHPAEEIPAVDTPAEPATVAGEETVVIDTEPTAPAEHEDVPDAAGTVEETIEHEPVEACAATEGAEAPAIVAELDEASTTFVVPEPPDIPNLPAKEVIFVLNPEECEKSAIQKHKLIGKTVGEIVEKFPYICRYVLQHECAPAHVMKAISELI